MKPVTKGPGRPPLDEADPSIKVTISLPSRQFDDFCARALREQISLPEVIRRRLDEINPKK
jgi:hypothetical protein